MRNQMYLTPLIKMGLIAGAGGSASATLSLKAGATTNIIAKTAEFLGLKYEEKEF